MARLTGITVLATGADADLGRTTIRRLVGEGAVVVAGASPDLDEGELEQLQGDLGARVTVLRLDVTDAASWEAATSLVHRDHGALHGLVNSASTLQMGSITDMEPSDLQTMIDVNLLGPALGIRTVAPLLRAAGGGAIVNIASTEALRGARNAAIFAATNWGLRGLTRSAALELGVHGIRVNTVCPSIGLMSPVDTEAAPGELLDGARPRQVTMGDVAAMVAFLLSDDSATCSGGDFLVDAGATA